MSPEVLKTLIGRIPTMTTPAFLPNFNRHPVKGHVYPGITPSSSSSDRSDSIIRKNTNNSVQGILLSGLSDQEMKILDWFEGDDYKRCMETILISKEKKGIEEVMLEEKANVYIWDMGDELLALDCNWDYDDFRQTKLDSYLKNIDQPCKREFDQLQ